MLVVPPLRMRRGGQGVRPRAASLRLTQVTCTPGQRPQPYLLAYPSRLLSSSWRRITRASARRRAASRSGKQARFARPSARSRSTPLSATRSSPHRRARHRLGRLAAGSRAGGDTRTTRALSRRAGSAACVERPEPLRAGTGVGTQGCAGPRDGDRLGWCRAARALQARRHFDVRPWPRCRCDRRRPSAGREAGGGGRLPPLRLGIRRQRTSRGIRGGGDSVNPIPVLSASEAAAWDSQARTQYRVPSRVLMETAGRAVVQVLVAEIPAAITGGVLVAAGAGNNGGDGWVIARALHAVGIPVWVTAVDPKTDDAIDNRALARLDGVRELGREEAWPQTAVAVDALLGTGAAGPAKGDALALAERVAAYGAPILAVDGPTGLDLTSGEAHGPVHARITVTFGGPRRGHLLAREWCGKVVVVDIGS